MFQKWFLFYIALTITTDNILVFCNVTNITYNSLIMIVPQKAQYKFLESYTEFRNCML